MNTVYIKLFRLHFAGQIPTDVAIADFQIHELLTNYIKDSVIIPSEFASKDLLQVNLPDFLEDLAQAYYETPSIDDEIIALCIERKNAVFVEHLTFLKEISYAIRYTEHKKLKKKLSDFENEIFENELELAFIKNERKQKKAFLQNYENQHEHRRVANYSSQSDSKNEQTKTIKSDLKSVLFKIAAIFIIAFVPLGMFFLVKNDGKTNMATLDSPSRANDSMAQPSDNQILDVSKLAETNRIINSPLKTHSWDVELLYESRTNQGYAGSQTKYISENIKISIYSTSYKIDSLLVPHINELKLAIENPKLNDSLKNKYQKTLDIVYQELNSLQSQANTFELKQDSLLIWKNKPLNRNTVVELFELVDFENQQKPVYILQIDNEFYILEYGKGKLREPLNRNDELVQRALYLR